MPIYEYECKACGAEFERIVSFERRDAQACECGAKAEPQLSVIAGHRYYGPHDTGFQRVNVKP